MARRRKNPGAVGDVALVLTIVGLTGVGYVLYKNGLLPIGQQAAPTGTASVVIQKKATTSTITTDSLITGLHGLGYMNSTALSTPDWWLVEVPDGKSVADASKEIATLPEVLTVLDASTLVPAAR